MSNLKVGGGLLATLTAVKAIKSLMHYYQDHSKKLRGIKIVVLGANGFVGNRVAQSLLEKKTYSAPGSEKEYEIRELLLFDLVLSETTQGLAKNDVRVTLIEGDITDNSKMKQILTPNGAEKLTCFHIAAVMSGPSERNFDLGMRVNLKAAMDILEIMRSVSAKLGAPQTYLFTSTDYVTCFNDYNIKHPCHEESFRLSAVSYGVQKACVELLVSDYSRKGFIDGRTLRLSCVIVKPGVFDVLSYPYHGIVSQTLGGDHKVFHCPLKPEQRFACSYIQNCVDCLVMLGEDVKGSAIGTNRTIQAPAISYSLEEIWKAVQQVATDMKLPLGTVKWVTPEESGSTVKEINTCPRVDYSKAKNLGLPHSFELREVILDYLKSQGMV
eukprot:CAMPEP_0184489416 /NCGR_PEP_ID=MMETSP0113_2-20130426/15356_1 /TAXON_ID=91329 /ORGANISM="Norrisiella sphaerica, Strain BC52" /LENGTH=382 /DNA_ID=CAMNT_0026872821 /DNA_START=28 /DNA_END=1176 /DNA_ORIENTATION=+